MQAFGLPSLLFVTVYIDDRSSMISIFPVLASALGREKICRPKSLILYIMCFWNTDRADASTIKYSDRFWNKFRKRFYTRACFDPSLYEVDLGIIWLDPNLDAMNYVSCQMVFLGLSWINVLHRLILAWSYLIYITSVGVGRMDAFAGFVV